jgi:hypothetical protein
MDKKIYEVDNISQDIAIEMINFGSNLTLCHEFSPLFVSENHDSQKSYTERIYHLRKFGVTLRAEHHNNGKVSIYAYAGDEKLDSLKIGEVEKIINEVFPIIRHSSD